MLQKLENMSFEDLYSCLGRIQAELREQICAELKISEKTFYNKLNSETFSPGEQIMISSILKRSLEELFPKEKVAS